MPPLVFLLVLLSGPPAADSVVTVNYAPVLGESRHLAVEKVRAEYAEENGALVLVDSTAHTWAIVSEVLEERLDGYALRLTYRPVTARSAPRAVQPRLEPTTGTLSGVPLIFRVDASGQPIGLNNARAVREALLSAMPRSPGDAEMRARLDALVRQTETDAGLASLVMADIERYHLPLGRRLPVGTTVEFETTLRNPFGEGEISAVERVRLDSLYDDGRRAHMTWSLTPDSQALARVVLELIEGFAPGAVELTAEELTKRFSVSEEASFELDPRRGTVYRAAFERRIRAGERLRVERTTFDLVEPATAHP